MVESPKTTHSSEMGWHHFLAASSSSWAWSWPGPGGAAKSAPITLNRKWAQRSWDREVDDVCAIGCGGFIFFTRSGVRSRFYTRLPLGVARYPLRELG